MNTVKRFSLSGVLVAFVAALLLSGSLLLATTQNAYAEEIDTSATYKNTALMSDNENSFGWGGTLAILKNDNFMVHGACIETKVNPPNTQTGAVNSTYADRNSVDKSINSGYTSLDDTKIEKIKKIIYVYSETNKLNGMGSDLDKYQATWAAIAMVSCGELPPHAYKSMSEVTEINDSWTGKTAYEYLMKVANGTESVTVPSGLEPAFFEHIESPAGSPIHKTQTLVALKLYGSSSGGTTEKVKTKVSKAWKNADGTTTWPSSVSQVEIEVSYNSGVVETIKLTSADTQPKETAEYDKVDGATFSVKEKTVKGYTSEVTGNDTDGFVVTNTESSEDTPTPAIQTSATGTSGNTIEAAAGQTITDTVTYSGLTVGTKYVLEGKLFDKSTGAEITTDYSCTANNFEPAKSSGKTTVTFTLDATDLAGKSLVVYEYLYTVDAKGEKSSEPVAEHADLTDAKQTVTVNEASEDTTGELATTIKVAGTDADGEKLLVLPQQSNTVPVVDTIEYTDLIKNATYTVTGTLMLFDKDNTTGKEVATKTEEALKAADTSGTWTINFGTQTLQPNAYYVVFESATLIKDADGNTVKGATPIIHDDIDDLAQAVAVEEVPNITFTHNDVSFNPAEDLTDEDKTKITQPKIGTTASAGGKTATATAAASLTETEAANATSVTDTIAYEGFGQDDTYTVTGTLYKVAMATPSTTTGSSSSTASTTTTTTTNTTPTAVGAPVTMEVSGDKVDKSGKGTWTMTFNSGKLEAGYKYYVQEVVTDSQGNVVASHGDANTPSQCIMVTKATTANNVTGATQTAKTADTATGVALLAALVAAGSAALLLGARRKFHN